MKYYVRIGFALYFVFLTFLVIRWRKDNIDLNALSRGYTEQNPGSILRNVRRKRFRDTTNDEQVLAKIKHIRMDIKAKNAEINLKKDQPYISHLLSGHVSYCGQDFIGYQHLFAKLSNVVVDPALCSGRKGGENISDVMNQSEKSEYYDLKHGFFKTPCHDMIKYRFGSESHLNHWLETLMPLDSKQSYNKITEWTIAVQRYEYVNMYHTMTDWFNTFLVTKVFNINPSNVTVLWIDGHPIGGLDTVWKTVFGKVVRIGEIEKPVTFSNMVWGIVGYDSPLDDHLSEAVPYLEEFRQLFLTSYKIVADDELDCGKLNVLLIWRRDYVAHPRNPSGSVARKIKNEDELFNKMKDIFEGHNVKALQLDKLPMSKQLSLISNTDILIGMHGAGLSHTLFLPRHAGLIEMFPLYHPSSNEHFRAMATWRGLYYLSWSNYDENRELPNYHTNVDVDTVGLLASEMRTHICKS